MKKTLLIFFGLILIGLLLITSCNKLSTASDTDTIANPTGAPPETSNYLIMTLGAGTLADAMGTQRSYELKKIISPSGHKTYAHWISVNNNANGAVIIFFPYEGLNWSDDSLDRHWFDRGSGMQNDDSGPFYNSATSSQISYTPLSLAESMNSGVGYLLNNISVLLVYGRFYAGTDPLDHSTDVKNGLWFLNQNLHISESLIGLQTGSWGGVGALYGIQQSPFKPKVAAIYYPVSDTLKMMDYVQSDIPKLTSSTQMQDIYKIFFDPYFRRIQKSVQRAVYDGQNEFQQSYLTNVSTNIFFAHDEWDTLVPYQHTINLMKKLNNPHNLMYQHNHLQSINYSTFPLKHAQAQEGMENSSVFMWGYIYQLTQLIPTNENKTILYDSSSFVTQFNHVLNLHGSISTSHYTKILNLLCFKNLIMYDYTSNWPVVTGSQLLNFMLNSYVPGWNSTESTVCGKLITQSPFD